MLRLVIVETGTGGSGTPPEEAAGPPWAVAAPAHSTSAAAAAPRVEPSRVGTFMRGLR